jgi:hypothetical protein
MRLSRTVLWLALIALPLASGLAQEGRPPGQVAARAFLAAPTPLALTIEAGDNTDENMALAQRLAREAARHGITVQPQGATLVLRFDTEVRTSTPQRQSFSRPGGAFADPDSGTPSPPGAGDEVTNMLSSGGGGVIRGRPPSGADYSRFLRYVINATLDDRSTGRRIWQGHVSYDTAEPDRTAMFVALAPVLAEQIGKNTQERPFRLD